MILTEKKLIFLHIPKTGGGSVHTCLCDFASKNDKILYKKYFYGHHPTFLEIKKRMERDNLLNLFQECEKFCVVRNPWDWHVSWYHYLKYTNPMTSGYPQEHNLTNKHDFNKYIKWLCKTKKTTMGKPEKNFSHWFNDEDGNKIPNYIFKLETIDDDVKKFNLKIKHLNTTEHEDYRQYYNKETTELVREKHKLDIKMFKYDFGNI